MHLSNTTLGCYEIIVSIIHWVLLYSLVSNRHFESELLTDYILTGYRVLSIVSLDPLTGARHAHTPILSR